MASPPPLRVVLDTNALLDWLVFRNPACAQWDALLRSARVQWIATEPMQAEWLHVLARGVGAARLPAPSSLEEAWQTLAMRLPVPVPPLDVPRCTDADDQKFVDLAILAGARWLVSRDRALLAMRRRLQQRHGVDVLTPESWNSALAAGEIAKQAPG